MPIMTTNFEWFQKAFYDISYDNDVINNLSDIKIALTALNTNQLRYTSSSLNLSTVFDCLNSSTRKQIELACEVLKTFLSALDSSTILNQYGIAMVRALKHPCVEVKGLVLQELNRAACESDVAPLLSGERDLLLSMVECVADKESAVARPSIQCLVRLGTTTAGLEAIYSPPVLEALNRIMLSNDTNRFRVHEIVLEVSANSDPGLKASHSSGILEKLLLELKKDDVMILLTTLEFVTKLALTHHGYNYLEANDVVHHLACMIRNIDANPLASLLLPGLIKFFGNVAQLRPQETFRDYPKIIEIILKTTESKNQGLACMALETVGYIATTTTGKRSLHKQGIVMEGIMSTLLEIITKWPIESRVRGLNVLANILRLDLSEQETEMLLLVQSWFELLGAPADTMHKVLQMAHQPFPEIKLAVLLLLQVLAEQPWSQQCIQDTPGLLEVILDRSCDSNMQEKNARFAVINTLAESPTSEAIFGEEMIKRLKKFTIEGAIFVQLQTEVAIERAD